MIRRSAAFVAVACTVLATGGGHPSARADGEDPAQRVGIQSIDGAGDPLASAQRTRVLGSRVIGQSVEGRDIVATEWGTPGGRPALVVGVIHGDETAGEAIVADLRTMDVPPGVELWLIDSVNPDGQAHGTRLNSNNVDLNRNFEVGWQPIPFTLGIGESAGRAPADQPETAAIEAFITEIRPQVSIWYHQASNRVSPGGARPELAEAYAAIVGQRFANTPCAGGCTGTETQFSNTVVADGTSFIVELPVDALVTAGVARQHAQAVMTVLGLP